MPEFISGLRLGSLFYEEAVKPVLVTEFAGLVHSAALIGYGSEILGYDAAPIPDRGGLRISTRADHRGAEPEAAL